MNVQVRYYSLGGNTKKLALAAAEALKVTARDISVPLAERADILFLGTSYYAFDMDPKVKAFVMENRHNIGSIVCFGTSAMMKSVLGPMKKVAQKAGVTLSKEEFHCRGQFHKVHAGRPNEADCAALQEFVKRIAK